MQSVVISLSRLLQIITGSIISTERWEPVDIERFLDLAASHNTSIFPRHRDVIWTLKNVLLEPDFYEECRHRIERSKAYHEGKEWAVLNAISGEGVGETALALRKIVDSPPQGESLGSALIRVPILWRCLEEVIMAAFPAGMSILGVEGSMQNTIDPSRFKANVKEVQDLLRFLHPPGYIENLTSLEPRLVFFEGSFPKMFPLAAAWSMLLRKRLPRALFVALDNGADLYSSPAQSREKILRSPAIFDWLDGIIIYHDLGDMTLGDIIDHIGKGMDSLDKIENIACKINGTVRFREPSPERVADHLARTKLAPRPLIHLARKNSDENAPDETKRTAFALITPSRQSCYWNQCSFCPTGSQHFIQHDPYLERRTIETIDLLKEFSARSVEMTFIGREVVPPSLLKGIIEDLRKAEDSPCWSYEGRFETFYTTEFISDLAAAGCRGIIFGLESPLDRLNGLAGKYPSGVSVEKIERIIDDFDLQGVAVHVNTIFDLPGSTIEDVEHHGHWLHRMFDTHRFFHFNTNRFCLIPGSPLSRDPSSAGLELADDLDDQSIPLILPVKRADGFITSDNDAAKIWEKIFGSPSWCGSSLEALHAFYHEETTCSFLDASRGFNYFKKIKADLEAFREPGSLVFHLNKTVEVVEADNEENGDLWLVDVGGTAGWIRLSRPFWNVLEICIDKGIAFNAALKEQLPDLPIEEQREAMRILSVLLADGFVVVMTKKANPPNLAV